MRNLRGGVGGHAYQDAAMAAHTACKPASRSRAACDP